ncbi:MAG: glycosyltransferase [Thermoguttaceae bacterium]|nr:glycosyltransferase [Thermoguttaceae bacterium]
MKILLFNGNGRVTNTVGGAEKVFCNFANEFVKRGFEVAAMYNDVAARPPVYPIDAKVRLFNLNGSGRESARLLAAKCWREISKPLRKTPFAPIFPDFYRLLKRRVARPKIDAVLNDFRPDVVVTFFIEDAKTLFFDRPTTDFATIQMLHNVPSQSIPAPTREDRETLERCDLVQVLMKNFVPRVRSLCSTEIAVLPNVVPQFEESVDVERREQAGSPRIICVGRLHKKSKRQHLAIEAFAQIAADVPDWTLCFFGTDYKRGRYRRFLERLIARLELQNRVFVQDSTPNVREELARSDIFAFPSAFEGFGLALAEAFSAGLPAVGFADAPAVNELIIDGENGFLATDVDDFAQKLKTLIDSKELRRQFGANAKKSVEKYEASKVWDAWETLVRETVEKKRAQNADSRR